jgi:UDP-2,3-diacylglucosamine hydrolase
VYDALFVSDLHLTESTPRTNAAFVSWLDRHAANTRHLFILGDLFEAWIGDDTLDLPHAWLAPLLHALGRASRQTSLRLMHGNRDFLLGPNFARFTGVRLVSDPVVIEVGTERILLTHGDALCTDDTKYQQFRTQVRSRMWQDDFLALPMEQRAAIVRRLRDASEAHKSVKTMGMMDVNEEQVRAAMVKHRVRRMIHGHTHRPAVHRADGFERWVLPDWDFDGLYPRGGALAATGASIEALPATA